MTSPPSSISGLGPHGEFAASVEQLRVGDAEAEQARASGYTVAMVLHTTRSDWAKLQIAGVRATLETYGAALVEVVDCEFGAERQVRALESLVQSRPDAIISIPVHNLLTADAHRLAARAGVTLVLMDNVPAGMRPGKDYASLVSSDNFGNGQVAAELLADSVPSGGSVGIIGFGVDFFVTNEREIAFRKWMKDHRPDVALVPAGFTEVDDAGRVATDLLDAHPDLGGVFVVWDEPAVPVVAAIRKAGVEVPATTIDLGNAAAVEIAEGSVVKGVGAQQPYDQGVAEATAAVMTLVGTEPPPWIALPGLSVTRANVLEVYEAVWHTVAPAEVVSARLSR